MSTLPIGHPRQRRRLRGNGNNLYTLEVIESKVAAILLERVGGKNAKNKPFEPQLAKPPVMRCLLP